MFITLDKESHFVSDSRKQGAGTGWHTVYNAQLVMARVLTFSREVVAAGDLGFSRGAAVQRVTLVVKTWTSCPMYAAVNCKEKRNSTTLTANSDNIKKTWYKYQAVTKRPEYCQHTVV